MQILFNWDLLFFGLGIFVAGILPPILKNRSNSSKMLIFSKKIVWVLIMIVVIYWGIYIPYISNYYNFAERLETPIEQNEVKYLENHQIRIKQLEDDMNRTQNELQQLQKHYSHVLQILMFGVINFACYKAFDSNSDDSQREVEQITTLKL